MCSTGEHLDGDVCSPEEEAMFAAISDPRVVATILFDGTLRREWFGDNGEEDAGAGLMKVPILRGARSSSPWPHRLNFGPSAGCVPPELRKWRSTSLDTELGFHR